MALGFDIAAVWPEGHPPRAPVLEALIYRRGIHTPLELQWFQGFFTSRSTRMKLVVFIDPEGNDTSKTGVPGFPDPFWENGRKVEMTEAFSFSSGKSQS